LLADVAAISVKRKPIAPRLDNLHAEVDLDEGGAQLKLLRANFEGQPLNVSGSVPLGREFWTSLSQKPRLPDWRNVTAQLDLPDWKLAALAHYSPRLLAPEGPLPLQASIAPPGRWQGQLVLKGAGTRPFQSLSPSEDLNAVIQLQDRTARIE